MLSNSIILKKSPKIEFQLYESGFQIIDDQKGITLASASTLDPDFKKLGKTGANSSAASYVGTQLAERAKKKGVKNVVFDRGGFMFHGRVKALADAAREAGLDF